MNADNPVFCRYRYVVYPAAAVLLTTLAALPTWANPPASEAINTLPTGSAPMGSGAIDSGWQDAEAVHAEAVHPATLDFRRLDVGSEDAGLRNAGVVQAESMNFEEPDSTLENSGARDSAPIQSEASESNLGRLDSGQGDFGGLDAESVDIGPRDAGPSETYLLGSGDLINLDIFNVPEHSGPKRVLVDGSISLAWVGNVPVAGLTLEQAAQRVAVAYGRHLRQPTITVSLVTPRPVQVSVSGAVNRPGAYPMAFAMTEGEEGEDERRWPTVTQALQQAGGISPLADVRQITVQRSVGRGRTQTLHLDLWDLLVAGNLSQDIPLRDGDTILVPTAPRIDAAESRQLALASFSPATIRVTVVGEVNAPGVIEVPPNTPLNQALMVAGGFDNSRAQTGTVDLLRLNADGTVSQREIAVNFSQGIDDDTNPVLYPDDVLIVKPSGNAQFSDAANGILGTLGLIVPFLDLFLP